MEGGGRNGKNRCNVMTPNAFVVHNGLIQKVFKQEQTAGKNESS